MIKKLKETKLADKIAFKIKAFGENKDAELTYSDLTTNMVVFGSTGSGKTVTGMYPMLKNFISNGLSGIVLDVKGDYTEFLIEEADDRLFLIGGHERCVQCNVLEGISRESFRDFIEQITTNTNGDSFWGSGGKNSSILIFDYHMEAYGTAPTLAKLFNFMSEPAVFVDELGLYLEKTRKISNELSESLKLNQDSFSILRKGAYEYYMNNYSPEGHPSIFLNADEKYDALKGSLRGFDYEAIHKQFSWHHKMLLTSLEPFSSNSKLKRNLSSEDKINVGDIIYLENKIIAVDMPHVVFGKAGSTICRIIRERFYDAVFSYNMDLRKSQKYGENKFTFMLIDEYQNYSNLNPDARYNDNTFVDKSRSFGNINIFSTQGVDSLLSNGHAPTVYSFLQNIRNTICLPSNGVQTIKYISSIEQGYDCREITHPSEMGVCYYNFAKNKAKNNSCDFGIGKLGVYYNEFLSKSYKTTSASEYTSDINFVENKYFSNHSHDENFIYNIVILTHKNGSVRDDFKASFNRRLKQLKNESSIPIKFLERYKPEVKYSYFDNRPNDESMKETLISTINSCNESTLILIRGGGSKEDFEFYNDFKSKKIINDGLSEKKITDFICAVGHFKDITALSSSSSIEAHTPSDLGVKFAERYYEQMKNYVIQTLRTEYLEIDEIEPINVDTDIEITNSYIENQCFFYENLILYKINNLIPVYINSESLFFISLKMLDSIDEKYNSKAIKTAIKIVIKYKNRIYLSEEDESISTQKLFDNYILSLKKEGIDPKRNYKLSMKTNDNR